MTVCSVSIHEPCFFFDVGFFDLFKIFRNFLEFSEIFWNFSEFFGIFLMEMSGIGGKYFSMRHHTSVANKSSEPYLWFFLVIAWIEAAVGKSYFLLFTEEGGCESLQKRKEHIRDSNFDLNNGAHEITASYYNLTKLLLLTITLG